MTYSPPERSGSRRSQREPARCFLSLHETVQRSMNCRGRTIQQLWRVVEVIAQRSVQSLLFAALPHRSSNPVAVISCRAVLVSYHPGVEIGIAREPVAEREN